MRNRCEGHRAAYDLSVHTKRTGHPLIVREALKEPIITEAETAEFNKKTMGKTFGKDSAVIQKIVGDMDEVGLIKLKGELAQGWVNTRLKWALLTGTRSRLACRSTTIKAADGKEFNLTPDMLTIQKKTYKQSSM